MIVFHLSRRLNENECEFRQPIYSFVVHYKSLAIKTQPQIQYCVSWPHSKVYLIRFDASSIKWSAGYFYYFTYYNICKRINKQNKI